MAQPAKKKKNTRRSRKASRLSKFEIEYARKAKEVRSLARRLGLSKWFVDKELSIWLNSARIAFDSGRFN